MGDISGLQVTAGAFGVVSVSALLMVLVQRVKDYVPTLTGTAAMAAVDIISLLVAAVVLYQIGVDWTDGATYVALLLGTLSLGIITRGHYASLFKVSVSGTPPSPEAIVPREAVHDPHEDEPRRPIAHTRPMTDAELTRSENRLRGG